MEYLINNVLFKNVEALDDSGKRVYLKAKPQQDAELLTGHILDRPDKVAWQIPLSHFDVVDPSTEQSKSYPGIAGSFPVVSGKNIVIKEPETKAVFFCADKYDELKMSQISIGSNEKGEVDIECDQEGYIGYVSEKPIKFNQAPEKEEDLLEGVEENPEENG